VTQAGDLRFLAVTNALPAVSDFDPIEWCGMRDCDTLARTMNPFSPLARS